MCGWRLQHLPPNCWPSCGFLTLLAQWSKNLRTHSQWLKTLVWHFGDDWLDSTQYLARQTGAHLQVRIRLLTDWFSLFSKMSLWSTIKTDSSPWRPSTTAIVRLSTCTSGDLIAVKVEASKKLIKFSMDLSKKTISLWTIPSQYWSLAGQNAASADYGRTDGYELAYPQYQDFHDQLNKCLLSTERRHSPCQSTTGRTVFQQFLHHSKMLQNQTSTELRDLFQMWGHTTSRSKLRKTMNEVSRQKRRQRRAMVFQQAREAARAHNTRDFFIAIRKLAPQTPRRPIHIRNFDGHLLHTESAADYLQQWYEALYSDPTNEAPVETANLSWPFDERTLANCFMQLQCRKAVTPQCAPSMVWRTLKSLFADKLQNLWVACAQCNQVPIEWGAATMIYLSKPGKAPNSPSGLRPISLLDPMGKVLMNCLGT